jgi:GT2 family glycosyltransferase
MEEEPLVFIVIAIHNGLDHTVMCLDRVGELDYPHFKVIVVDDGSTDDSARYIGEHYPEVILIEGDGSLWWSGAVNLGIRYALEHRADYVCLLNNDNTFGRNFLTVLVDTARSEDVPCVCSKVYKKDTDRVFYAGGTRNRWGELVMRSGQDCEAFNVATDTDWAGGMGVLIRCDVFSRVGLFDEKRFPHYFGDADFYFRLRAHGYRILFQPDSVVYNDTASTGRSYYSGTFGDLFASLFSRKSHLNLRDTARFYYRYSRKYVPPILAKRVIRIFGGYVRALVKRKNHR